MCQAEIPVPKNSRANLPPLLTQTWYRDLRAEEAARSCTSASDWRPSHSMHSSPLARKHNQACEEI